MIVHGRHLKHDTKSESRASVAPTLSSTPTPHKPIKFKVHAYLDLQSTQGQSLSPNTNAIRSTILGISEAGTLSKALSSPSHPTPTKGVPRLALAIEGADALLAVRQAEVGFQGHSSLPLKRLYEQAYIITQIIFRYI